MTESIFLLSPANLNGKRGKMLLNPDGRFALAQALRSREGAALGDVYAFVSGLYFRGKAAYATKFARSSTAPGVWVMTPGGGLCGLDERVTTTRLAGWQRVRVADDSPHFTAPILRQTSELLDQVSAGTRFILLGSIASRKYVGPLLEVLGPRLFYPTEFEGRGDMSRGALLLRCVRDETELEYAPVAARATERS